MAVELRLSGHEPEVHSARLCTNQGYNQIQNWMDSLPKGAYPAVDSFAKSMVFKDTDQLFLQMNQAALEHGPASDGTDQMVALFLDGIGPGYDDETAEVRGV